MAEKQFKFTSPDGKEYLVTVPEEATAEEAYSKLQEQISESIRTEYAVMPWYQKAGVAADDVMRIGADSLSFGGADRIASALPGGGSLEEERFRTEAARTRAGGAAIPIDVLAALGIGRVLPSAIDPVVKAIGGPAGVRAVTGGTVAATETGVLGGLESQIRDQDLSQGIVEGILAGPIGHSIGGLAKKGKEAYNWVFGSKPKAVENPVPVSTPKSTAPAPAATPVFGKNIEGGNVAPKKTPTRRPTKADKARQARDAARTDFVTAFDDAVSRATLQSKGATSRGFDRAITDDIQNIINNKALMESATDAERDAMIRIVTGDPAVKAGRSVGRIPTFQGMMGGAGVGAGTSFLTGNIPLGVTLAGAVPTAGVLGRATANRGARNLTKQASDIVHSVPPPTPAITKKMQEDLANVIRLMGIGQTDR